MNRVPYASLVGAIMYTMTCTLPDVAYGEISWKSSKQANIVDSTTEAEYVTSSEVVKEVVWIKNFLTKLGVVPSMSKPVTLLCDNNGAIVQAQEPISHQKTKHYCRKYYILREFFERGDIKL